jgi:hypothetical protein
VVVTNEQVIDLDALLEQSHELIDRLKAALGEYKPLHIGVLAQLLTDAIVTDLITTPPAHRGTRYVTALDMLADQVMSALREREVAAGDVPTSGAPAEIHDISERPEDETIRLLADAARRNAAGATAFVVESNDKADRFMAQLAALGIQERHRSAAPDGCVVVTIAPRGN